MLPNNSLRNKIFRASQILIKHFGTWIVIPSDYVHIRLSKQGFAIFPSIRFTSVCLFTFASLFSLPRYIHIVYRLRQCVHIIVCCRQTAFFVWGSLTAQQKRLKVNINLRHDSILVAQYRHRNIERVQKKIKKKETCLEIGKIMN